MPSNLRTSVEKGMRKRNPQKRPGGGSGGKNYPKILGALDVLHDFPSLLLIEGSGLASGC